MSGALLGDRYALGDVLGEGGMGVVYRATDTLLERTVAVKVFREGTAERARTASETQILASLNHPALVTLFDAQVAGEEPRYFVMEFVDGPTLRSRLGSGPLAPRAVARLARDLAEALHVVHRAGIVHRDIKPANVLLRPSSVPHEEFHPKLADFGIAYLIDATRLTVPGAVIGSAAYLSPEQVSGEAPGPASDIYSLGLVLIEALTGRRAFPQVGRTEAALARLTQDPIVPGSVGRDWGRLLTDMTARDPAHRPPALDVVIRAADIGTRAVPVTAAATVTADATVADVGARPTGTEVGSEGDRRTLVEPLGHDEADPPGDAPTMVLADGGGVSSRAASPARRPRRVSPWAFIAAALVAAAVVVGVVTWLPGDEPAPVPTLPALDDPLGSHLEQLMDAVSP